METPREPLDVRRARSLDRPQGPRRGSDVTCRCLSLPSMPRQRAPARGASHRPSAARSPARPAEAPEEMEARPPGQPGPPQDARKDQGQRRAQQGWLKTLLGFFLGPEEPREKAGRRPKGKEPALARKAHGRAGHRRHPGAGGREAGLPSEAASLHPLEAGAGPARGGAREPPPHPSSPTQGAAAGPSDLPPHASGAGPEEPLRRPDQNAAIQMTVELLKKVGDQWEEEHPCPRLGAALQIPAPACRRKSQEKKTSLQRAFSLKKFGPEEPRRAGPAGDPSAEPGPEPRPGPPKRPSFLPLCLPAPSSPGLEDAGACEVDGAGPSPPAPPARAGQPGPQEELMDRASEFNKFIQKILALLQDAERQEGEQCSPVREAEVAPAGRRKSQERRSGLRRAFSHKKHSAKAARSPKRPRVLPLCAGGHRSSLSSLSDPGVLGFQEPEAAAERGALELSAGPPQAGSHTPGEGALPEGAADSKELFIRELVASLQEMDGQLGEQVRRHPSFKSFFYEFPEPSLRRLVATLRRQGVRGSGEGGLAPRSFPMAMGLAQELAGNPGRAICSLMGSRGHYGPLGDGPANPTSPESLSPD